MEKKVMLYVITPDDVPGYWLECEKEEAARGLFRDIIEDVTETGGTYYDGKNVITSAAWTLSAQYDDGTGDIIDEYEYKGR